MFILEVFKEVWQDDLSRYSSSRSAQRNQDRKHWQREIEDDDKSAKYFQALVSIVHGCCIMKCALHISLKCHTHQSCFVA